MLRIEDLPPARHELALAAVANADSHWDDSAALLQKPIGHAQYDDRLPNVAHNVRETSYYALGLLLRGCEGDHGRAARALDAVLDAQFDALGEHFHGSFKRATEEPPPDRYNSRDNFMEYDPNWRQFIGCVLTVVLEEYRDVIPPALARRIERALIRAVVGELSGEKAGRIGLSYTNIALMHAHLLTYVGERFSRTAWLRRGLELARGLCERYFEHEAFDEYNSTVYYFVDLCGLGYWQRYNPIAEMRQMGGRVEAALWRDAARYYHAGLQNFSGPFDRSFNVDMRVREGGIGWDIEAALGREYSPYADAHSQPRTAGVAAILPAVLGTTIPVDAAEHFKAFQAPRQIRKVIRSDTQRIATAWLEENLALGAERGYRKKGSQVHALAYWRTPDGDVGWFAWADKHPIDAIVEGRRLTVTPAEFGDELPSRLAVRVCAPGVREEQIATGRWELPGLNVEIATTATDSDLNRIDESTLELIWTPSPSAPDTFTFSVAPQ